MPLRRSTRRYRFWRRLWHGAERAVTAGRWPARLAVRLGASADVIVERHDVHVAGSLGGAEALRIAFASDFHAGPTTPHEIIDAAVEQLADAKADVLLLGGDFVSLRAEYGRDLVKALAAIPAPLGRYAVLGNHDHWSGGTAVAALLERAGIEMLTNRNVQLPAPFNNASLCGLDDHTTGQPDADAAFDGSEAIRIVLMHAPSNLLDIGDRRFDVALCGHTHGGQIALASGRPIKVAHGPLSRQYNAGRFALSDGRILLVSRGVGCTTIPLRVNASAAVLTCTVYGNRIPT